MTKPPALALLPLLVLPLAGCGDATGGGGTDNGGTSVVTSLYPLEYVAARVAGDHADVRNLTPPGQEPHDAELTVPQTAEVMEADVLVHLSGFQPAVDEAVAQSDAAHVVDAADAAELIPLSEDAHEGHDHEEHEGHEGEELDPHFWLDPSRLADVGEDVADALAEADPDHADDYRRNLEALQDDLTALDDELHEGLADCERDAVVVSHNAFQYWAVEHDLHMHAIAGLSPESEPSPQHLAELQELVREEGVTTVFSERLASPKMAETLADDLGLRTAVLDPIEGLTDETADEDYLSLMRRNLAALQEANGCR